MSAAATDGWSWGWSWGWVPPAVADWWDRLLDWAVQLWTGKSRLERQLSAQVAAQERDRSGGGGGAGPAQIVTNLRAVARIRQLQPLSFHAIFSQSDFDVAQTAAAVLQSQAVKAPLSSPIGRQLTVSLEALSIINAAARELDRLAKTTFEWTQPQHAALLASLWTALKPGYDQPPAAPSTLWRELGFQGNDPSTDFRGLGLLGLIQLEHLARMRSAQARAIFLESLCEPRYFPFAATGINFSLLTWDLVKSTRLVEPLLYRLLSRDAKGADAQLTLESLSHTRADLVARTVSLVHEAYCDAYQEFLPLWLARHPKSIMDFPPAFADLKDRLHRRWPTI